MSNSRVLYAIAEVLSSFVDAHKKSMPEHVFQELTSRIDIIWKNAKVAYALEKSANVTVKENGKVAGSTIESRPSSDGS